MGERRKGLALRGDCPGIQSSAWYLVGLPASASLLAAFVVMLHGLEAAEGGGMVVALSSPYSGPAPPLFQSIPGRNSYPLFGEGFE